MIKIYINEVKVTILTVFLLQKMRCQSSKALGNLKQA